MNELTIKIAKSLSTVAVAYANNPKPGILIPFQNLNSKSLENAITQQNWMYVAQTVAQAAIQQAKQLQQAEKQENEDKKSDWISTTMNLVKSGLSSIQFSQNQTGIKVFLQAIADYKFGGDYKGLGSVGAPDDEEAITAYEGSNATTAQFIVDYILGKIQEDQKGLRIYGTTITDTGEQNQAIYETETSKTDLGSADNRGMAVKIFDGVWVLYQFKNYRGMAYGPFSKGTHNAAPGKGKSGKLPATLTSFVSKTPSSVKLFSSVDNAKAGMIKDMKIYYVDRGADALEFGSLPDFDLTDYLEDIAQRLRDLGVSQDDINTLNLEAMKDGIDQGVENLTGQENITDQLDGDGIFGDMFDGLSDVVKDVLKIVLVVALIGVGGFITWKIAIAPELRRREIRQELKDQMQVERQRVELGLSPGPQGYSGSLPQGPGTASMAPQIVIANAPTQVAVPASVKKRSVEVKPSTRT